MWLLKNKISSDPFSQEKNGPNFQSPPHDWPRGHSRQRETEKWLQPTDDLGLLLPILLPFLYLVDTTMILVGGPPQLPMNKKAMLRSRLTMSKWARLVIKIPTEAVFYQQDLISNQKLTKGNLPLKTLNWGWKCFTSFTKIVSWSFYHKLRK